jgi:hypothetical protein
MFVLEFMLRWGLLVDVGILSDLFLVRFNLLYYLTAELIIFLDDKLLTYWISLTKLIKYTLFIYL